MIKLTNTFVGKKENFDIRNETVQLYVCGITPYDYAHIGHGRCYVLFDVLYRYLHSIGVKVTYCRNFTDIDDKLLCKAEELYGDKFQYKKIADAFIENYLQDMESLNCLFPDYQPRVTEVIDDIIEFIEGLIKQNCAYVVDGDVYFSVKNFSEYGQLSKRKLDQLCAGARVDINELKRDPLDFALWKSEKEETFWKSPWGWGRPGWHIECSVMAYKDLGKTIDIHGGGMDLIFPHHENEKAQSEALWNESFARIWMHVAFVQVNKEKMSKSLGNFFTLRELFNKFDPMVIRFYLLSHHYRSPIDFSLEELERAEKVYRKLCKIFAQKQCALEGSFCDIKEYPIMEKIVNFIEDDLNTVGIWGVIFEHAQGMADEFCVIKGFVQNVLGLTLEILPEPIVCITPEIQELVEKRQKARAAKDWATADTLREQLKTLGYEVQD
jgi:cysteinyl-tRNA synthetase